MAVGWRFPQLVRIDVESVFKRGQQSDPLGDLFEVRSGSQWCRGDVVIPVIVHYYHYSHSLILDIYSLGNPYFEKFI